MTGFLTEILSVHPQSLRDSPAGACASASLRRHLHCFGFPDGNLADAPVRPCWALLQKSCLSKPQSLRDSPLLRGATPIRPLAGGPVACPQACSLIGNSM